MLREFKAFLLKQNVLALAIAVVVGAALNQLVTALVDAFVMPIVVAATPAGTWQAWTVTAGSVVFKVGVFLGALLNFLIVGVVAWRMSKIFIKEEAEPARASTKQCPHCRMTVDALATRCAHCTSQLGVAA